MNLVYCKHYRKKDHFYVSNKKKFLRKIQTEGLVIELFKRRKGLNTIASENNIQPNLLRNWKKEFDKASVVFDDSREDNSKEKLALERKEKPNTRKSWPAHHAGGLVEKKSEATLDPTTRVNLVRNLLKTKEFDKNRR